MFHPGRQAGNQSRCWGPRLVGWGALVGAVAVLGCTPLNGPKGALEAGADQNPDGSARADGDEVGSNTDAPTGDAADGRAPVDVSTTGDSSVDVPSVVDATTDIRTNVDAADGPVDASIDTPMDVPMDAPTDAVGCARYTRGPRMVAVPSGCIDSTEVTVAQYQTFLVAQNGSTSGQGPECTWNVVYAAALMCAQDPVGHANYPINGVDWCDATAYCRWAGKRLCGHVGGGAPILTYNGPGPANMQPDLSRPDVSEWIATCSHAGERLYPYGGALIPEACNGEEHSGSPRTIVAVGTTPGCEGGYPGVFDMAGNVHEWEDACTPPPMDVPPGQNDLCFFRGGSYHDVGDSCPMAYGLARNYVDADCDIGFRCCADP